MPSSLGWIAHDERDRERMTRILALFREKESRDELGLGGIRDSIAEQLFPGTSTLHTRMRYVLFVAWVYRRLEERGVSSAEIGSVARRRECELMAPLLDENEEGVLGRIARNQLKRLPSSVYWNALHSWGLLLFPGSQSDYHHTFDKLLALRAHARRSDDNDLDAPLARTWHEGIPDAPASFPEEVAFALTEEEAAFVRDRICERHPSSLLAWLVRTNEPLDQVGQIWMHPRRSAFVAAHRELVHHAHLFAEVMQGAAMLYNLELARLRDAPDLVSAHHEALVEWLDAMLVERLVARFGSGQEGAVDQRWYWAALVLLDAQHHSSVLTWLDDPEGLRGLFAQEEEGSAADGSDDEDAGGFERHVEELLRVARGGEKLGRVPDDLGQVLADFALASPAICAVRAILRVSRLSAAWDPHVLGPAARVARGFRTLFNVPESLVLLRGDDDAKAYWRRVLEYCVDGNLQAVLDEYAHLLVGSEGLIGASGARIAERVSGAMLDALSPRTVNLAVDEVQVRGKQVRIEPFRVRCRYALRFGDQGDEDQGAVERAKTTREAFNSPFRPFVLTSTSVGQEGLDFHHYCHAVYHWNLPTNPVDLEQREGRVHRYKGHAIRRNIAAQFGLQALRTRWSGEGDPWERLFELAAAERPLGATELLPYWVFETEGGVTVERRVPLLPLSREVGQLEVLRKQLAVYRLAFGQPRQEDLVAYLSGQGLSAEQIDGWRICLEPPVIASEI